MFFLGLVTTSPSSDALSDPILAQSLSLWETTAIKILAYLPTSYSIWIGGTVTKKTFDIFLFSTTAIPNSAAAHVIFFICRALWLVIFRNTE